ncbi:hypothetical protein [Jiella sp. R10]|uniref:Uncharacterized protein n=1 Tax=Antarcticirhabdus aurantiaca TaxID=2606717 RepID=A0ACD4NKD6_9HYPH|nr:hypothetical protein OXU80_21375 [Jeongeuplla avenae]
MPRVATQAVGGAVLKFPYSYEAMGQILEIVRGAGGTVSNDYFPQLDEGGGREAFRRARIKRMALWRYLSILFTLRDRHDDLRNETATQDRCESLRRTAKLSSRLAEMLESDAHLRAALMRQLDEDENADPLAEFIRLLPRINKAATDEADRIEGSNTHLNALMPPIKPPPKSNSRYAATKDAEFFRGLRSAFKKFFDQEPTILQDADDAGEPYGPFVAFVMAVKRAAGEPITASAVKQADYRSSERKRDSLKKTDDPVP